MGENTIPRSRRATPPLLDGRRFGFLTVTGNAPHRIDPSHQRWVIAICDCGKTIEAAAWRLVVGKKKSCGCRQFFHVQCRKGHLFTPENTLTGRLHGQIVRRCLTCHRIQQRLPRGNLREQTVRRILSGLAEGLTVSQMTMTNSSSKVTSWERLNAYRLKYPKIGKLIFKRSADNAVRKRQGRTLLRVASPTIVRVADDIMAEISAAVPKHLPRDLRDDVIQNIWTAVIEGRMKPTEITLHAINFVRTEYQTNHNAWGDQSLDVPISVESGATLLDRLSTDLGTGYWDMNMMASTGRRK